MGIEVLIDDQIVYRSTVPICRTNSPKRSEHQRILAFQFKGGRLFEARHIQTTGKQTIEGNIWVAGVDTDALLLGVSFSTKKQILLNSIHIAQAESASTSELDRGIVVKTFPVRRN